MGKLRSTLRLSQSKGKFSKTNFGTIFGKVPREILSGTVITALKAIMHVNTVNTVPAEISRGPFRKSYRNSFCKTSLLTDHFFLPALQSPSA